MKIKAQKVSTYSSEEVLYSNPENADMGNPNGDTFGLVYRVLIELEDGSRYLHNRGFSNPVDGDYDEIESKVEALANRVREAGEVNLEHWFQTHSVYGSDAWVGDESDRRYRLETALRFGDAEAIEQYS